MKRVGLIVICAALIGCRGAGTHTLEVKAFGQDFRVMNSYGEEGQEYKAAPDLEFLDWVSKYKKERDNAKLELLSVQKDENVEVP